MVRKNRLDEARATLLRLTSTDRVDFDVDKAITLMVVTTEQERDHGTGSRYLDCFKGIDLRRTTIVCGCWVIQILSGSGLRSYSTYFYKQAGLPTYQAFNMSIAGYALGIVGVFTAWFLLPHMGRRTMYLVGLICLAVCLIIVGILGTVPTSTAIAWAVGSLLLVYTFFYDVSVGPVCYSLVSELPSVHLRSKSIVLARASYNGLQIVSNVITPYMLNPSAWNWGAKAGFFYGGACLLSLLFTYFMVPEPKGRTYGELNLLFQKRVPARQFSKTRVDLYGVSSLEEEH